MIWVGTSWKMNKTLAEGLAFAEALAAFAPELRRTHPAIRHPLFHRRTRGEARARGDPRQGRRPEHALGRRRRLDRRGLAGEAQGLRARPDRARPQRAPRAFRRDRPDRRTQDRSRSPPRLCAADLRRRDARGARVGPRRRGADRADRGRAGVPRRRAARRPDPVRLRAGLGDRREGHPGDLGLCRPAAGADQARGRGGPAGRSAGPLRRQRQPRQRRRADRRSPMSTASSSAARPGSPKATSTSCAASSA